MNTLDKYEIDWISSIYKSIQSKPITIPANAKPDLSQRASKPYIVDIPLAEVPKPQPSSSAGPVSLTVTVKNIKASQSTEITVQSTSTIKDIKKGVVDASLASSIDSQRLLLKGKALMDDKLVKDYDSLANGSVLTLMLKPGSAPVSAPTSAPASTPASTSTSQQPQIPQVELSSADSDTTRHAPDPVIQSQSEQAHKSDYDSVLSDSAFWKKLNTFLTSEFKNEEYGRRTLETFFLSIKPSLTASEIALIREQAGFEAMGKQE
ncbi:hypothetical protein E3P99_00394 [Wallemia hederae]|uniref:Ubiquitin-like domain-containing protein n=1 Tax=Wallemia hederae TaxID=1540922 RepID=A0A4T0FVD9_9BASI|nr:hypothetical protein E3P99_00394 [Wallemia hederae]